jgi:putative oxidoreductase
MSTTTRPSTWPARGYLLLATSDAAAPAVARLVLAAILFPHGAQHALGWFGGYGFAGTLGWMTGTLHLPVPLAALAIVVELIAPLALVVGFAGRAAALGLALLLLVAASTHTANGFFMNWFGQLVAGKEGFEYHLLAVGLAAVVVLEGSGARSVDRALTRRRTARGPASNAHVRAAVA